MSADAMHAGMKKISQTKATDRQVLIVDGSFTTSRQEGSL
jgi:hypothetical protein